MPTKLRKLKITRVAVCPQGANPDADILLFKSAEPAVSKEEMTTGDVYTDTFAGTSRCTDPDCTDPHCPVHGTQVRARRKKKRVEKGPIGEMGMHGEPDGDEATPLDYATRGQQYDLWETLWDKWQCLCATYNDVCGDWDTDNIPNIPILERSIGQFQDDVHQLLVEGGVLTKIAPHLTALHGLVTEIAKVGAAMAGHRLTRLQEAIAALQQILDECTPEDLPHGVQPPIDRAGMSAADAVGLAGYMTTPALRKGRRAMAVRKNTESDKDHCASCDDDDCDNPAHDRMNKQEEDMADTLDSVTKRAELAEARAKELEARVADLEPLVAKAADLETTIAKMKQSPEEQEAEYWATVPEPVRKKHEADEAEKIELRKQLSEAREEREQTVYLAKTADFRGFGMVAQPTHARILKAIDSMDDEVREELVRLIKANQEQARTAGLFEARGTEGRNGAGTGGAQSASDELMALTKAYMDDKGVDWMKASEAVAKDHRDLYQRSVQERRRASRVSSD
jgi:hypothetical protein